MGKTSKIQTIRNNVRKVILHFVLDVPVCVQSGVESVGMSVGDTKVYRNYTRKKPPELTV